MISNVTGETAFNQSNQNGNGDDDGDRPHRPNEKRLPDATVDDEMDKEEDTEEDPEHDIESNTPQPSTSTVKVSSNGDSVENGRSVRKRKSNKRGSMSPPKKRTTKSIPVETMLEDDHERDEEVAEVFMDAFFNKVRITTESRHPNLFNELLKIFQDAAESAGITEHDILPKVKCLLRDYPQLQAEFSTFMQEVPGEENNEEQHADAIDESAFHDREEAHAYFNFMRHLEASFYHYFFYLCLLLVTYFVIFLEIHGKAPSIESKNYSQVQNTKRSAVPD